MEIIYKSEEKFNIDTEKLCTAIMSAESIKTSDYITDARSIEKLTMTPEEFTSNEAEFKKIAGDIYDEMKKVIDERKNMILNKEFPKVERLPQIDKLITFVDKSTFVNSVIADMKSNDGKLKAKICSFNGKTIAQLIDHDKSLYRKIVSRSGLDYFSNLQVFQRTIPISFNAARKDKEKVNKSAKKMKINGKKVFKVVKRLQSGELINHLVELSRGTNVDFFLVSKIKIKGNSQGE